MKQSLPENERLITHSYVGFGIMAWAALLQTKTYGSRCAPVLNSGLRWQGYPGGSRTHAAPVSVLYCCFWLLLLLLLLLLLPVFAPVIFCCNSA